MSTRASSASHLHRVSEQRCALGLHPGAPLLRLPACRASGRAGGGAELAPPRFPRARPAPPLARSPGAADQWEGARFPAPLRLAVGRRRWPRAGGRVRGPAPFATAAALGPRAGLAEVAADGGAGPGALAGGRSAARGPGPALLLAPAHRAAVRVRLLRQPPAFRALPDPLPAGARQEPHREAGTRGGTWPARRRRGACLGKKGELAGCALRREM